MSPPPPLPSLPEIEQTLRHLSSHPRSRTNTPSTSPIGTLRGLPGGFVFPVAFDGGGELGSGYIAQEKGTRLESGKESDPTSSSSANPPPTTTTTTPPEHPEEEDQSNPFPFLCCCEQVALQSRVGTSTSAVMIKGEREEKGKCETRMEMERLEGELKLAGEIGLQLLSRLSHLQASYDPLQASHKVLQESYGRLMEECAGLRVQLQLNGGGGGEGGGGHERVGTDGSGRSTSSHAVPSPFPSQVNDKDSDDKKSTSTSNLSDKGLKIRYDALSRRYTELLDVLEKKELKLIEVGERVGGLERRLRRGLRAGGKKEEKEVEAEAEGDVGGVVEVEVEVRAREEKIRELLGENTVLRHRLTELEEREREREGSEKEVGTGGTGSGESQKENRPSIARSGSASASATARRKRMSMGFSPSFRFGETIQETEGAGPPIQSQHRTETSESSSIGEQKDSESTRPTATNTGGRKLRPLSLSLSISSNATHAGPSSALGMGGAGWIQSPGEMASMPGGQFSPLLMGGGVEGNAVASASTSNQGHQSNAQGQTGGNMQAQAAINHARHMSLTPSISSTRSNPLTGSASTRPSLRHLRRESSLRMSGSSASISAGASGGILSPRGSWAPGMSSHGWENLVRDADGCPIWPQPGMVYHISRSSAGEEGMVKPNEDVRSGSGSALASTETTPNLTMDATGSGSWSNTASPQTLIGEASPRQRVGVGYALNGVPKSGGTGTGLRRSMSMDRPRGLGRRSSHRFERNAQPGSVEEPVAEEMEGDEAPESEADLIRQRNMAYRSLTYRQSSSPLINEDHSLGSEPDSMVEVGDTSHSREESDVEVTRMPRSRQNTVKQRTQRGMRTSKATQTEAVHITPLRSPAVDTSSVRATLGGLGFQEDSSSVGSTPQLLAPFSPQTANPSGSSDTTSVYDPRTGALLLLVEHVSKILVRLRQADVPALTRRLKKQHLVGADVGHLSKAEMKALTNEIAQMRAHFKTIMEEEKKAGGMRPEMSMESALTRKDFNLLLKLFKELLAELTELRGIVNEVTVNPAAAVELKKKQDALLLEEDGGKSKAAKGPGGMGWIAPITKLFAAPAGEVPVASGVVDKKLLQPPTIRSAAKLTPSTSASVTQVSVAFASSGQVRRATHALPLVDGEVLEGIPISPTDTLSKLPGTMRPTGPSGRAPGRPALTLGDGSSRGPPGRQSLYGIFAGVPNERATSSLSQANGRPNIGEVHMARSGVGRHKRQLSTLVDAVIDDSGNGEADEYQAPLLERTLRPRGLSDSSIHTTFQRHGVDIPAAVHPDPSLAAGSYWSSSFLPKNLGKRFQAFAGRQEAETTPESTIDETTLSRQQSNTVDTIIATPPVQATPVSMVVPRTITKKRSANQLNLVSPGSLAENGGFLSMLSNNSASDPERIFR